MHSFDLIKMAIGNLIRRKVRTALTILGVVIGTVSIVTMLSLGIAMNQGLEEQISSMGDLTVIEINSPRSSSNDDPALDDDAIALLKQLPNVVSVMPIRTTRMKIASDGYVATVSIIGIDADVMEAFGFEADTGRILSDSDSGVIVYGANVEDSFYDPRVSKQQSTQRFGRGSSGRIAIGGGGMPGGGMGGSMPGAGMGGQIPSGSMPGGMGRSTEEAITNEPLVNMLESNLLLTSDMEYGEAKINLSSILDASSSKLYDIQAIGKLKDNSSSNYNVYMDMGTFEKILAENEKSGTVQLFQAQEESDNKYERISVKVNDYKNVAQVLEIIEMLGFQTFSLTDILTSMEETSNQTQAVLGGIGAISLLVAAIGITNTMIMSINERTREIGVMKVIGADLDDIKRMFLLEAGVIGFGGGVAGILISYGVSYILNNANVEFLGYSNSGTAGMSVIPMELSLIAIVFASLIGLISGYIPARRAMGISALDAIRTDK